MSKCVVELVGIRIRSRHFQDGREIAGAGLTHSDVTPPVEIPIATEEYTVIHSLEHMRYLIDKSWYNYLDWIYIADIQREIKAKSAF